MNIGVIGCRPELPIEFPISMPENSGNMIHAMAPLKMFKEAVWNKSEGYLITGNKSFRDFVNNCCSHLIITMANSLKLPEPDPNKYERLQKSLEQYNVPIVVFGLGIQAKNRNLEEAQLCNEAIELLQFLSSKANLLGVRGDYTKQVIEKCCNISNVHVTGCPSLFSNPSGLRSLKNNLAMVHGKPAVNVTHMGRDEEKKLFARAVSLNHFMVEPVNKFSHEYYLNCIAGIDSEVPYFIKSILESSLFGVSSQEQIRDFYTKNYRLFRNVQTWFDFNQESVSMTYGTRFHVNMASILSGKPALWLTHDARTVELVELCKFPHLDLANAVDCNFDELIQATNYDPFFANISRLFDNFNFYLEKNGLPILKDKL